MNPELVELLLGELEPARVKELRARLGNDPSLRAELAELEALFGFMRRGEEIEADPAVHAAVMAEARRITRPSLLQQLRTLPALFRFRFRHSRAFRIAAVSLGIHVAVMLGLLQLMVRSPRTPEPPKYTVGAYEDVPDVRPDEGFVMRISFARVSRSARLAKWGVGGQRDAIREGVETLLSRQRPDGSFGSLEETSRAALVLLAENVRSADDTTRGRALRRALHVVRRGVEAGGGGGGALVALVEDWALSYDGLTAEERHAYVRAIHGLVLREQDAAGRYWAEAAGFPVPGPVARPDALAVVIGERHEKGEFASKRAFRARFEEALAAARAGDAAALLVLQAPYRI